jgi:hypothetical protein
MPHGNAESCPCPQRPGRHITDRAVHAAFHELVISQGGPVGVVNAMTLREARGMLGGTPGTTAFDVRVEKLGQRASGARRRAAAYDG